MMILTMRVSMWQKWLRYKVINIMIFAKKICWRLLRLMLTMNLRRQLYLQPSFSDPRFGLWLFLLLGMIYLALYNAVFVSLWYIFVLFGRSIPCNLSNIFLLLLDLIGFAGLLFWCTIWKFRTSTPSSLSARNIRY